MIPVQNLSELASLMGDSESEGGEESTMTRQLAIEKLEQFLELEQWRFTQSAQSFVPHLSETELTPGKDQLKVRRWRVACAGIILRSDIDSDSIIS